MPDNPTQEGSIVAFLKLDDSDWNAKLDEAEQKARDLGRIDPTVHVRADTSDAMAKLEAVRMAAEESGLGDVTTTVTTVRDTQNTGPSEDPAAGVRDAVAQRNTAMQRYSEASDAAAQAQRDLSDAESAGDTSAADLASAQERSAQADRDAAQAKDELTAAAERIKQAMADADRASRSQSSSTSRAAASTRQAGSAAAGASSALSEFEAASRTAAAAELARSEAERSTVSEAARVAESTAAASSTLDSFEAASKTAAEAELARSDAERSVSDTATEAAGAAGREASAVRVVGGAASAAGAGMGDLADNTDKAGNSANRGGGYYAVLAGVIASLIPIAGPLAGYVAGVGGAFMGMGAAGVMAVLGIKNEMAAGTVQGQEYSSLMTVLSDDLHTLENTAASGVLTPFKSMVDQIDASMPQLTSEIGGFARDLGDIGGTVVGALISGFQTLNPLFSQGAQYVQHLADVWSGWVSGGGLNQFAADAEQALPIVSADLGNLLSIAMKVISGLAPFGTTVLQALQAVSGVLNMLPTSALTGVAVAAATVFAEFRMWSSVQPIITAVERSFFGLAASEDAALGPIGLVVMGVTALGLGVAAAAESTQRASQDTQDYTVMLEQTNGAIDQNIRKQVAQKLVTDGTADSARKYGVSLSELTTAVISGGPALDSANTSLAKQAQTYETVTRGVNGAVTVTTHYAGAAGNVKKTLDGAHKSFTAAVQNVKEIGSATSTAAATQAGFQTQVQQVSAALAIQAGFATSLTNDLNLMNGITLNQVQAATAQAAAINSASTSFKTNGKAILGNSSAAVANQQAIEAAITAIDQHGEAVATATGSQKKGTAAILDGRNALLRQLQAQHELTPAIQTFIDKLTAIPTKRNVDIAVNTVQAENAVNRISNLLAGMQSVKTINVNTVEHTYGVGIAGSAPHHALGGTIGSPSGTVSGAGSSLADSVLSWLAPGEEVVSNTRGQASMFRDTLKAINAGKPAPQVAATLGVQGGEQRVVNHYEQHFHVTTDNPQAMFQYAAAQTNALAMV